MNVQEIIIEHLDFIGAEGLYNEEINCFCERDNLFYWCDNDTIATCLKCLPARQNGLETIEVCK